MLLMWVHCAAYQCNAMQQWCVGGRLALAAAAAAAALGGGSPRPASTLLLLQSPTDAQLGNLLQVKQQPRSIAITVILCDSHYRKDRLFLRLRHLADNVKAKKRPQTSIASSHSLSPWCPAWQLALIALMVKNCCKVSHQFNLPPYGHIQPLWPLCL